MTYKKYNLIFIVTLIWVAAEILAAPAVWAAPDDLVVVFENTPLFNEANFLPGSEVGRWVKVKNNTPGTQPIIVETINESDPYGLAGVFEIGIYEGGIQRYGTTTLAAFFAAGEVSLSNLAGGGMQTQYDFLVRFVPGANNSYQEKSLGFDILIGFKGDEGSGGSDDEGTFTTTPPSGGGGGGGGGRGGGNGPPSGLVISSDGNVVVGETTATISWLTSFFSTSRVIYGTTPGVFTFLSPPNYGYGFSTAEFNTPAQPNGVTFHTVVLTGLVPGTTYYYRVISHASPDTISKELSFTTLQTPLNGGSVLPLSGSNVFAHSENAPPPEAPFAAGTTGPAGNVLNSISENEEGAGNAEEPLSDETSRNAANNDTNLLSAALFGALGDISWWWFLLLLLLPIAYRIYRRYKSDTQ